MNIHSIALIATVATGIVGSLLPSYAQADTSLNILYSNAYVNKVLMDEIKSSFEATHPGVEIKYDVVKNYTEMTQLMLRSALTGSLPDVGFQGLSFVRLMADRDLAVPISHLVSDQSYLDTAGYSPSALSMAKIGDESYGIPFEISIPTIYYNAELVRQAGVDPEKFPADWEGIVELAKKINAPSGGIYFDYLPTGNWTFIALVQSLGGKMMSPDERELLFGEKEGQQALDILRAIGQSGMKDMTRDQAKQAFVGGSLGILITSSSDITLYTDQVAGRFDLKVASFPVAEGVGTLPAGGNAAMVHTQDPKKQQLAWEFVRFSTSPEMQTLMATKTAYMPVSEKAINDDDLLGQFYDEHPNLLVPVKQLPIVTGWFSFPGENSMEITKVIEDKLRDVIILQKDTNVVMDAMVSEVSELLPN
ncbi:ABC transporter substrate-binding protein [Sinorhizobium meliloti]|uniref:ABC transporter substrate-binding protein n=1 Tax=Rhizobium meliloti TaxID=382 RepID=UPI0002F63643|nr:ABC transporter substrate-binding protein [Sinorhizobium meliloti]MDE4604563.1 ABC transporter substrate-binding protein [Sinorhizobium meliloti]MDX0315172.1 extracellular solute-binding protein [Sinorhizobium meliloti]UDU21124.1 ABC transporter substrate-binding protein [Sinorhizobium meliloti]